MFIFLVFLTLLVLLPRLYPLAVLRWIDRLDAFLEEHHQRQVEQYLRELHDQIVVMKMHLAQGDLDPFTRTRLQRMCDDYEHDLRAEVLSAEEE
jgi:hypothetical protein